MSDILLKLKLPFSIFTKNSFYVVILNTPTPDLNNEKEIEKGSSFN